MNDRIFWCRFGDHAEYISTNFEEFINQLIYRDIKFVCKFGQYGLEADGFKNLNHISAYYGDEEGQALGELTYKEIDYINSNI